MTATAGASSAVNPWNNINFDAMEQQVTRLQMRIAKAVKEGKRGKAKALQWLLTHSFAAKCLAVLRVTQNKGNKTPGVDGVCWKTPAVKYATVFSLKQHGYKAQPLRRLYIPKQNGKKRPLGIPTMKDRAMQAVHAMALSPVAETTADPNSYGFRPKRSAADAIESCFNALSRSVSAKWILEADIKACFDNISHDWLMENVQTDKRMLAQWLKSGYMESKRLHSTEAGTPQGGIISPIYANMVLDGLEDAVKQATKGLNKIHVIRYADDFIVTADSPEILQERVKPAVEAFLQERGLSLSEEKTHITHINTGFKFLGFNIRKYKGKLLIKPDKSSVKGLLNKVREIIKSHPTVTTEVLIKKLNPVIRGWANYYRYVVSKDIFGYIDHKIHHMIQRWIKRRHPKKNREWRKRKYFATIGDNHWRFYTVGKNSKGLPKLHLLFEAGSTVIKRHIKIRAGANPFLAEHREYFNTRKNKFVPPNKEWSLLPVHLWT